MKAGGTDIDAAFKEKGEHPRSEISTGFFNEENLEEYGEALGQAIELIRRKIEEVERPFSGISPGSLKRELEAIELDRPSTELENALQEVKEIYLDHAVYFHHRHYMAHLNCPIVIPAIVAEVILSSVNSSLDTWDQSGGGTLIEQKVIEWTTRKLGLGAEADGVFTSGGTQSNWMALLLARDSYCRDELGYDIGEHGLPSEARGFRIYASEACHFSVQKTAGILGLGRGAVVPIRCDRRFKMDAEHLETEIRVALAQGHHPIAIVATAGTTDFGSIDPLRKCAGIARNYGVWLHVDAAYGSGLLNSPTYERRLAGIEDADSVTVDYHKSFFQPVSCAAFFVRNRRHLAVLTHHADYLNPVNQSREGIPNLVDKSIQTTKRFDALKIWLTLRVIGSRALGTHFDAVIDLAQEVYRLFQADRNIELLHVPELSTVVFRYVPGRTCRDDTLDILNRSIAKALFRTGHSVIATTKVSRRTYLKLTLLNPNTTCRDVEEVLCLIRHYGEAYFHPFSNRKTPFQEAHHHYEQEVAHEGTRI